MPVQHKIRSKNGGTEVVNLTPIRAIRLHCLECVGHAPSEVRACTSQNCPLFPYRMGTNPERAGIGGNFTENA